MVGGVKVEGHGGGPAVAPEAGNVVVDDQLAAAPVTPSGPEVQGSIEAAPTPAQPPARVLGSTVERPASQVATTRTTQPRTLAFTGATSTELALYGLLLLGLGLSLQLLVRPALARRSS